MKMAGELPETSWSEVAYTMIPYKLLPRSAVGRHGVVRMIQRSTGPCPVQWQTPLGKFWGRDVDQRALQQLMVELLHEQMYNRDDNPILRPGDIVVDVGAHLGTYAALALQQGASRVIAIEAEPVNAACLAKTFATEIASGRVVVVPEAAWETEGTLTFHVRDNSLTGSAVFEKGVPVQVPATTLDLIVERNSLPRVDLIKMDIEGGERHALRGAQQTIMRFKPRMAICVYHLPDDPTVIPALVREFRTDYAIRERGTEAAHVMFFH
jgi:FkbM family methyltransferase